MPRYCTVPIIVGVISLLGCDAGATSDREVRTLADTTVSLAAGAWTAFPAPVHLMAPAWVSQVCLAPTAPAGLDSNFALISPSGERVVPEGRALRVDGGPPDLLHVATRTVSERGELLCLALEPPPNRHPPYRGVELRSPVALSLSAVEWVSADK